MLRCLHLILLIKAIDLQDGDLLDKINIQVINIYVVEKCLALYTGLVYIVSQHDVVWLVCFVFIVMYFTCIIYLYSFTATNQSVHICPKLQFS